ncbi:MAG TPA: hypothetical protein VFT66_11140 [Roseiflexaceae bacterium]|nr:hypothetical protein [Roseiflexaceae bacterium]
MSQKDITIGSILQELAGQYHGAVAEREVYDQVLARRPSQAKDPYASIRQQIRYQAPSFGWVRLGGGEIMPLHVALRGLRFRLIPSDEEFAGDMIARWAMRPFWPFGQGDVRFEDAREQPIHTREAALPQGQGLFGTISSPALQVGDWFKRTGFEPGDSIIVTITSTQPLTFRLEREPAGKFRASAVAAQEQALLDGLVEWVKRSNGRGLSQPEDGVLGLYARAPWRTEYPGRPWQQLVAADGRLRIIEGDLIAEGDYRSPFESLMGEARDEQYWAQNDAQMLEVITSLQSDLLSSRRAAVERGLWDGVAPRVSMARTIFNLEEGTAETIYPGAINATEDHSADIEEHIAHGDYDEWDELDDLEEMDYEDEDEWEVEDDLLDVEELEDLDTFMEQNPKIAEATRQLLETLSPEEIERLQDAESLDEVNDVLGRHLSDLMRSHPSLFEVLQPPASAFSSTNGNGHNDGHNGHNGHTNGYTNGAHDSHDGVMLDPSTIRSPFDSLHDDFSDAWIGQEEQSSASEAESALDRSNDLMEQFYTYQVEQGKSDTTATNRTRDLWIYADFLGNYYGRSLDAGDYATLDECLFFYYPRKVLGTSPRALREMCTSIKQFYAFARAQGRIMDDSFAVGIWQRRDQAGRVLELYDQLDADSPQFDRLFAHLFAPYTA